MSIFEAFWLGIIQGLTEFIPVSSSGHLVIMHDVFGISDGGLTFDVALHIGTLLALILFFHKEVWQLYRSVFIKSRQTRLAWLLLAATVPAIIAGVLLEGLAESSFRSAKLVAVNLIIVAVLMLIAERVSAARQSKTPLGAVSRKQAWTVGVAQAVALVPGVSRSGSTITAGLFAGLDRVSATRFSFLLAIPVTLGAVLKVLLQDSAVELIGQQLSVFLVGIVAALISGLLAIKFLLRFLSHNGLHVFAYYRILLGAILLLATLAQ